MIVFWCKIEWEESKWRKERVDWPVYVCRKRFTELFRCSFYHLTYEVTFTSVIQYVMATRHWTHNHSNPYMYVCSWMKLHRIDWSYKGYFRYFHFILIRDVTYATVICLYIICWLYNWHIMIEQVLYTDYFSHIWIKNREKKNKMKKGN